jgi:hypothetical protein
VILLGLEIFAWLAIGLFLGTFHLFLRAEDHDPTRKEVRRFEWGAVAGALIGGGVVHLLSYTMAGLPRALSLLGAAVGAEVIDLFVAITSGRGGDRSRRIGPV